MASAAGLATVGAAGVALLAVSLLARRFAPYLLAVGILGGAVYAQVPFERTSTQNRTLIVEPVRARAVSGALQGINHTASGRVSVVEAADGTRVVRFERFHVQGAPAPVLYVAAGVDVQKPGGTNLGAFTATDGDTLDVALPAGVAPVAGWTLLIWCERFATPIANATLR
jgi:hypothetical protein